MNKVFFYILLCVITLATIGCQKFLVINAGFRDSELVFIFGDHSDREQVLLYGFSLNQVDCDTDCLYWHVANKIDEDSGRPNYILVENNGISYAQKFPKMDLKMPAKQLVAGEYVASGNIRTGNNSKILYFEFFIDKDENGKFSVRKKK